MTPQQREITERQIASFKKALADPWRELRDIEAGHDPIVVRGCTEGMRSVLADLESQLKQAENR